MPVEQRYASTTTMRSLSTSPVRHKAAIYYKQQNGSTTRTASVSSMFKTTSLTAPNSPVSSTNVESKSASLSILSPARQNLSRNQTLKGKVQISSTFAPFWTDKRLMKSKVFAMRLFDGAAALQRIYRGYIRRKYFCIHLELKRRNAAATKIQALARGWIARRQARRLPAAIRIQAWLRGCWGRMTGYIVWMEAKLKYIEERKQRKLEKLREWKEETMDGIRAPYVLSLEDSTPLGKQLHDNREEIRELTEINQQLLRENEELYHETKQAEAERDFLTNATGLFGVYTKTARHALGTVTKDYSQWQHIQELFERRTRAYQRQLDKVDSSLMMEKMRNRNRERSLSRMMTHVQLNDFELFKELKTKAAAYQRRNSDTKSAEHRRRPRGRSRSRRSVDYEH